MLRAVHATPIHSSDTPHPRTVPHGVFAAVQDDIKKKTALLALCHTLEVPWRFLLRRLIR